MDFIYFQRGYNRGFGSHDADISSEFYSLDNRLSVTEKSITKELKSKAKHSISLDSTPSLPARLLLCFSVRRNGSKILNLRDEPGKNDEERLACLHGLRAVSLAWVIMVHTYLQVFAIAENKRLRTVRERDLGFQTISNATFSVDTFFTISGLLVAFLYFRAKAPKKNSIGGENNEDSDEAKRIRCPKKEKSAAATDTITFFKLLGYRFLRLVAHFLLLEIIIQKLKYIHSLSHVLH
ncbi:hypothetical protein J437_LFUL012695 [Ladona fulva]|uniref:Acyltransferase 3 domain-containing protein n=1 Tax=Ladona fulva TaxID=123851 RepID=A0A8K0JYV7_LADFU|nr:hypothetical protein J437_LFUL012695 [Ladona fulva]